MYKRVVAACGAARERYYNLIKCGCTSYKLQDALDTCFVLNNFCEKYYDKEFIEL